MTPRALPHIGVDAITRRRRLGGVHGGNYGGEIRRGAGLLRCCASAASGRTYGDSNPPSAYHQCLCPKLDSVPSNPQKLLVTISMFHEYILGLQVVKKSGRQHELAEGKPSLGNSAVYMSPFLRQYWLVFDDRCASEGDAMASRSSTHVQFRLCHAYTLTNVLHVNIQSPARCIPSPNAVQPAQVTCASGGKPSEVLSVAAVPLPSGLEWGEVLISIRVAPINPADVYTTSLGGQYGPDQRRAPYVAGHDGIGVVAKVRRSITIIFHGT